MPAAAAAAIVIALVGGFLATRDNEQSESALLAELQSHGALTFPMSDSGEARLVQGRLRCAPVPRQRQGCRYEPIQPASAGAST